MSKQTFAERAWEEYLYWQKNDKKTLKRVNLLLKDIARNGNDVSASRNLYATGMVGAVVLMI